MAEVAAKKKQKANNNSNNNFQQSNIEEIPQTYDDDKNKATNYTVFLHRYCTETQ